MPIYANQDFSNARLKTFKEEEETGVLNEFGKGFGAGVDQLQALAGGAKALVGSAVGNDDWFYDGMQYFDEQMAEAAENTADVGRLEDIDGGGDLANYAAFIVGNIIPSLIGGGGVGALGGFAAKKLAIHQGAKALVKKNAEGMAKSAASRQYAQSAVGREALGKVGLKGQVAGAVGFGTVMGAGESFTRIFDETGEEAAGWALVTGLASGALDAMTPMRVLKRVLPQNLYGKATQEIAENVSKKQSVIGRAFKEAAKASGTEGVTEMMQEVVQNSTLEFVRGQQDPAIEEAFLERLFDEENRSQYLNAFVAGAIGGGAIGGVTGAVTKDPELKQNLDENALDGKAEDSSPEVALDEEQAQEQEQEQEQTPVVDDQPQPEATDKGGAKVQAAREKALGLPQGRAKNDPRTDPLTVDQAREQARSRTETQIDGRRLPTGRTTIAPKSREEVRREIDDFPERQDRSDPEARQAEARAKARAQVEGLPAVREKVKEIYQMELGTLGETTRIPKDKEPEPVAEEPPVFGGNLPESITPRMEELVGQDVDYNGNKGPVLKKDDGFYVATQDNGDVLIESGEYQSPEQLGVVPTGGNLVFEKDVQIDDNNKFELRGKKYSLTRIVRDADGEPLSLAVRDENGAKKTIRTPEVVARINNQKNPAPDFNQLIVELDDLPASIQKQVIQQSDADNIPDSVPASQAIEIAQSMPNPESVVEGIQELATQSLTIPLGSMNNMPAVPYTEDVTRPNMKPLAQAISDINDSQGANRSPIDQGRIDSLFASPEVVMQNGNTITVAEGVQADEIKHALVDLLGAGLPKRVMNYVSGFYSHTDSQMDRQVAGSYLKNSKAITLNSARVKELIADKDNSGDFAISLRYNLAHEIGHAFDVGTGHTTNSPDFSLEMDGLGMNSATYEMGPVIHELGQNYLSGTELGQELAYPFGPAFEWIANSEPQNIAGQVDRIQKEAFAQAFAIFHTSPELLQEQAPKTYKHLEKLLRTKPTETIQNGEADIRTNEADGQPQEVQGDVRSPTQRGSTQVQEQEGAGGDGGSSLDAEQASQGLGEPTQREAGDGDGRAVQLEEDAAEARLVEQELGDIDDDYDPMDDLASFDDDGALLDSPPSRNPQRMTQAETQGFDTKTVFYHGTASEIQKFSAGKLGESTGAKSAKKGFWFTDSSRVAQSYADNSAVAAPVRKILSRAELAMQSKDEDTYDRLVDEAEKLENKLDAERRNGQNIIQVFIPKEDSLLVKDMRGRSFDDFGVSDEISMEMDFAKREGAKGVKFLNFEDAIGLYGVPSTHVVIFNPSDVRSINAQFDPAKTQSDDLLASPPQRPSDFVTAPTSTAAEIMSEEDLIASVRAGTTSGGESGIPSSGIKKWLQKNFSSRGLLPETAFDSMIQRDGEFGAVELDIRQMVGIYDNAVVENFGKIDGQQRKVLDDAMKRPASEIETTSLPRDIKDSLIAMRGYIDSLSAQYAQVLNDDINTLKAQGDEQALAKSELLGIVVNNMGTYANRSYQAFNNKDWNKEVPDEVVLAARNFLVEQGTANPDQVVNTILKEGTAYDDMASFISESKLGAKDLAILTQRKQIAPEIRALLGEYKDPRVNFANSASKMSRLIYNDRFLKEVLASGNGVFLFDQESAPADATKKIAEVGSKTMSPLNGMYTYPEVEQAFRDALGKEEMGDLYRTIIKVNGLVKYGKTVIAPTTMFRNFMSASMFTVANGHFNWSKLSKSTEVAGSYFSGIGDGVEYLKNLKKLGVVHDSPYAGEMIAYLQDANAQGMLDQRDPSAILDVKDSALTAGKSTAQFFTKAYQFGDDFWKIVGFENEVMSFMENKGVSREEAEPLAAKRIRDTYPTYSLIGKIPQMLRRFPLVGTFVSFPAEIVRTQANMIKYLREDLADPDMRPAALKRITGMAMMSAGVYAAQAMAMSAFGVSEEEEEAIKLMAAPWAKNSNILVTGRDDQGRLEYLDLTHLDPYALMKRPLNALMRDQPIDDALIDASAEILKPFLGWDISTNTILEFISNEKSSGGQVYNEADTFINQVGDTYLHFERGMGPSVAQNVRRMSRALGGEISKSGKAYDVNDEMAAFVGFRKTTFDPKTALHFKAYEFSEGKRQSTRLLTSVFRDPNDVSDDDIREAFGRASTARKETFNDMAALVSAAMVSGLSSTQAMSVLRSNGVTKKDARALVEGGASAWTMSDSTLKNSIVKSDILFGQQKSQEFKDRWTLIQQLLNEEN